MCMKIWSDYYCGKATFYKVVCAGEDILISPVMKSPITLVNDIPEKTPLNLEHGELTSGAFHLFTEVAPAIDWIKRQNTNIPLPTLIIPVKVGCCSILLFSEDKTQVAVSSYTIDNDVYEAALQGKGVE